MRIGKSGLALIQQFEGLRLRSYKCPAGVWTIGYGHTTGVRPGQECSAADAARWLEEDCLLASLAVESTGVELSQNEFDALVSFVYNTGVGAYRRSTLRALLQAGKPRDEVAREFLRWNKAKGRVVAGLTRRRVAEQQLFMRSER